MLMIFISLCVAAIFAVSRATIGLSCKIYPFSLFEEMTVNGIEWARSAAKYAFYPAMGAALTAALSLSGAMAHDFTGVYLVAFLALTGGVVTIFQQGFDEFEVDGVVSNWHWQEIWKRPAKWSLPLASIVGALTFSPAMVFTTPVIVAAGFAGAYGFREYKAGLQSDLGLAEYLSAGFIGGALTALMFTI